MIRASGAVIVALVTLVICCNADHQQEQELSDHNSAERYESGTKPQNLESLAGSNLVRQVREAHRMAHLGRRYDYLSPYGSRALLSPLEYGYYGEGFPKRNFDEIDRSNLNTFVKKRNFDEIDLSSMPFPFKRFYHLMGPNYLDNPVSNLDKKRYRPDYPMDEIDLSPFPIGSKRSSESHSLR
ncbi:orcokinin peptides-like isoform X1 [Zerene cesonia]|uniref:orcokinin peptides-like isoform X1 n=1 Tax=Zerene cesonia TaxID=33412 RepID=UPI0018E53443|nr:orcokinin peptides-like isoform X1 [Zerene cesonia]